MKKITIVLIIASVLFLFGIGFTVYGVMNIDTENFDLDQLGKKEEYSASEVSNINISCDSLSVEIIPSQDGKIHLSYGGIFQNFKAECKDGTLNLKGEHSIPFIYVGTFSMGAKAQLAVPENYNGNIFLNVEAGEIEIENITLCGNLNIETEAGAAKLENIKAEKIQVSSDAGATKSSGCVCNEYTVENDVGAIDVKQLDAKKISLQSDVGAIKATLVGKQADYNINSETSLGSSNLPSQQTGGVRNLTVRSDVGTIHVTFEAVE